MMRYKAYVILFIPIVYAEIIILILLGNYLEPLQGDMTRIGRYSENDFGWNQPQRVFPGTAPALHKTYDQYSDVLVFGDSFSFAGQNGGLNFPWQSFLAAETGFSVITMNHYNNPRMPRYDPALLPSVVNSNTFQKTPPRIVIMEVIERQLDIFPDFPGDCKVQPAPGISSRFELSPNPNQTPLIEVYRNKKNPSLADRLTYAKQYLSRYTDWKHLKKPIVLRLGLTNPNLFSNRRSDEMLAIVDDVNKKSWNEKNIEHIHCKLVKAMNLVQSNGKTLFVVMIVPDKLTAYSKYLQNKALSDISIIEPIARYKDLFMPRLDIAIKSTIDQGVVDVYLPNDTHWAYMGHKLGASVLAKYIKNLSVE